MFVQERQLLYTQNFNVDKAVCFSCVHDVSVRQCSAKVAFLHHLTHEISNVRLSLGSLGHCPKKFVSVSYCFHHMSLVFMMCSKIF